jgi:hypothetical protein
MTIKVGDLLLNNKQIFRVLGEEDKKLWPGQLGISECIKVVGIVDNLPTIVYLLKKELISYRNITEELKAINLMCKDILGEENLESLGIEKENRGLRIDLKAALKKFEELKIAFNIAQNTIEEKDSIIEEFSGSPADIRKAQDSSSIEDIRNAVRNRGKSNVE